MTGGKCWGYAQTLSTHSRPLPTVQHRPKEGALVRFAALDTLVEMVYCEVVITPRVHVTDAHHRVRDAHRGGGAHEFEGWQGGPHGSHTFVA